jgi:hypothetical protein
VYIQMGITVKNTPGSHPLDTRGGEKIKRVHPASFFSRPARRVRVGSRSLLPGRGAAVPEGWWEVSSRYSVRALSTSSLRRASRACAGTVVTAIVWPRALKTSMEYPSYRQGQCGGPPSGRPASCVGRSSDRPPTLTLPLGGGRGSGGCPPKGIGHRSIASRLVIVRNLLRA